MDENSWNATGCTEGGPMHTEHIELTTQRLREFAEWEARNPPESGVVKVTRDPHGAFWRWVETRK